MPKELNYSKYAEPNLISMKFRIWLDRKTVLFEESRMKSKSK